MSKSYAGLFDLLSIIGFKYSITNSKNSKTLLSNKMREIQEQMLNIIEINKMRVELEKAHVNPVGLNKALEKATEKLTGLSKTNRGLMKSKTSIFTVYNEQRKHFRSILGNNSILRHFKKEYGILFKILEITHDSLEFTNQQMYINTFNNVTSMMNKIWSLNTMYSQILKYATNINTNPINQFKNQYSTLSNKNKIRFNS